MEKNRFIVIELPRGYTTLTLSIKQTPVDSELIEAHHEKTARRFFFKMSEFRSPNMIPSHLLTKGTLVDFFEKRTKEGF